MHVFVHDVSMSIDNGICVVIYVIINTYSTVEQRCTTVLKEVFLMITIKQYAEQVGKTQQAVYKQLKAKKNQERLAGHIIKENGTTFLDDIAVEILNESRSTPIVIADGKSVKRIQELEDIVSKKEQYIAVLEAANAKKITENEKLKIEMKLIEDKSEEQIKRAEDDLKNRLQAEFNEQLQSLQRQLDAEKHRKLTLKERLFGTKSH